jgi:hypothetical protein
MNRQKTQSFVQQIKAQSKALVEKGDPMGSPLETMLIESWATARPDLTERMQEWGALRHLAHVVADRLHRQEVELIQSGYPPSDARVMAWTDQAMMERPETA